MAKTQERSAVAGKKKPTKGKLVKTAKEPGDQPHPDAHKVQPVEHTDEPDGTRRAWFRISDLTLDPENARQHGDHDLEQTGDSIQQFTQLKNIVIDADGIVRAGNGTCQALLRRGKELVWGMVTHLRGAEAIAYALKDNRTGELSFWNPQQLGANIEKLKQAGVDTERLGWDLDDLQALARVAASTPQDLSPLFDPAGDPAPNADGKEETDTLTITLPADKMEAVKRELLKHGQTFEEAICNLLEL